MRWITNCFGPCRLKKEGMRVDHFLPGWELGLWHGRRSCYGRRRAHLLSKEDEQKTGPMLAGPIGSHVLPYLLWLEESSSSKNYYYQQQLFQCFCCCYFTEEFYLDFISKTLLKEKSSSLCWLAIWVVIVMAQQLLNKCGSNVFVVIQYLEIISPTNDWQWSENNNEIVIR